MPDPYINQQRIQANRTVYEPQRREASKQRTDRELPALPTQLNLADPQTQTLAQSWRVMYAKGKFGTDEELAQNPDVAQQQKSLIETVAGDYSTKLPAGCPRGVVLSDDASCEQNGVVGPSHRRKGHLEVRGGISVLEATGGAYGTPHQKLATPHRVGLVGRAGVQFEQPYFNQDDYLLSDPDSEEYQQALAELQADNEDNFEYAQVTKERGQGDELHPRYLTKQGHTYAPGEKCIAGEAPSGSPIIFRKKKYREDMKISLELEQVTACELAKYDNENFDTNPNGSSREAGHINTPHMHATQAGLGVFARVQHDNMHTSLQAQLERHNLEVYKEVFESDKFQDTLDNYGFDSMDVVFPCFNEQSEDRFKAVFSNAGHAKADDPQPQAIGRVNVFNGRGISADDFSYVDLGKKFPAAGTARDSSSKIGDETGYSSTEPMIINNAGEARLLGNDLFNPYVLAPDHQIEVDEHLNCTPMNELPQYNDSSALDATMKERMAEWQAFSETFSQEFGVAQTNAAPTSPVAATARTLLNLDRFESECFNGSTDPADFIQRNYFPDKFKNIPRNSLRIDDISSIMSALDLTFHSAIPDNEGSPLSQRRSEFIKALKDVGIELTTALIEQRNQLDPTRHANLERDINEQIAKIKDSELINYHRDWFPRNLFASKETASKQKIQDISRDPLWLDIENILEHEESVTAYVQGLLDKKFPVDAPRSDRFAYLTTLYEKAVATEEISDDTRNAVIKALKEAAVDIAQTQAVVAMGNEQGKNIDVTLDRALVTKIKESPLINHHRGVLALGHTDSFHQITDIEEKTQREDYKKWLSFLVKSAHADPNDLPLDITVASLKELMRKTIDKTPTVQGALNSQDKFTKKFDEVENIFKAATIAPDATLSPTMRNQIVQAAKELSLEYVDLATKEQLNMTERMKETKNQDSQVAWVDDFVNRVRDSQVINYHRNTVSKGLDQVFSDLKTPSDAIDSVRGIATASAKKTLAMKQETAVKRSRVQTANMSNELQINWQALSYDDRAALNEQLYRSYLTWAGDDPSKQNYQQLSEYLGLAFQNCLDSGRHKVITADQQESVINSLKILQVDAGYHYANKRGHSNLSTTFASTNPALVDYHHSSVEHLLGIETKTRGRLNKIANAYSATDEAAIAQQTKMAKRFNQDKPGTIAYVEQRNQLQVFASENQLNWGEMAHASVPELTQHFLGDLDRAVKASSGTEDAPEGICYNQLIALYEHVVACRKTGLIDQQTADTAIQALKGLSCDLAYRVATKDSIAPSATIIQASTLVKHHRSTIKSFFSSAETNTQQEIRKIQQGCGKNATEEQKAQIAHYAEKQNGLASVLDGKYEPESKATNEQRSTVRAV